MKKKINFMLTAFRDGFQSAYGARILAKDFMPAVEAAKEAGINHYEAGGGARFQSLYFYLNEDAFEMMDQFRKVAGPDADLQTLSRGVNVVGLDSQPRDIIKLHAQLFKKHGISTIRNFDALNDVNNLIDSGKYITEAGLNHEVTVTMMALPPAADSQGAHTADFYMGVLKGILDANIPFTSVCFKDASGTSTPQVVYETIKRARKMLGPDMKIVFHSHETAGVSVLQYKAAIEAGISQIDLSMAPVSGGTCQPDIITMWHALRGTDYTLDVDINKIMEAENVFKDCLGKYFLPPEATMVNPIIPFSPLPGGALTANTQMLRDNGLMHKFTEITEAMSEVVVKGGFGTSVTPVSQFYFQQAFNNVMFGKWKKIAEGYGKMVLGYFGKTPVAPDAEIVKIASEQLNLQPTTKKVVDINDSDPKKGAEAAKKVLDEHNLPHTDENIFIAASCKEKGILYLTGKAKVNGVRFVEEKKETKKAASTGSNKYTVTVSGKDYQVELNGDKAKVNGKEYPLSVVEGFKKGAVKKVVSSASQDVKAPLPGLILKVVAKEGDEVKENDLLLVMEAMKMETEVFAPCDGVVQKIHVSQGDQKVADDVLVSIASAGAEAVEEEVTEETAKASGDGTVVKAPLPGLILRYAVKSGDQVKKGDLLLVMEAMKMETEIFAPCDGTVGELLANQGDQKVADDALLTLV